jgi:hypothetical protein
VYIYICCINIEGKYFEIDFNGLNYIAHLPLLNVLALYFVVLITMF